MSGRPKAILVLTDAGREELMALTLRRKTAQARAPHVRYSRQIEQCPAGNPAGIDLFLIERRRCRTRSSGRPSPSTTSRMKLSKLLIALTIVASSTAGAQDVFSPKALFDTARSLERTDKAQAISLYENSAKGGYVPAQLMVANLYQFGIGGVTPNCKTALYWYERADEQGSAEASAGLAATYADENSECFSPEKSLALYKDLAEKGSGDAQHALAMLYIEGRGVSRNVVVAHAWLSTAMKSGHYQSSLRMRDHVELSMTEKQISEAKELAKSYAKNYVKG